MLQLGSVVHVLVTPTSQWFDAHSVPLVQAHAFGLPVGDAHVLPAGEQTLPAQLPEQHCVPTEHELLSIRHEEHELL